MDFYLFLAVNAVLFIRPGELVPALHGWPIYNVVCLIGLVTAAPRIARQLTAASLSYSPVTVCVFGVLAFVILSHVLQFNLTAALAAGFDFVKVVAYFLLLMATVNTPRRLVLTLSTVCVCTLAVNVLAVLQYFGHLELATISAVAETVHDPASAAEQAIYRMRGTGIFHDPNDLSMMIVMALLLCAGGLLCRRLGMVRFALACPMAFLVFCLALTHSRGGLLALLVGGGTLVYARAGAMPASLLGMIGCPALLMALGGRQADIAGAIASGTGRSRIELWSSGLQLLKTSPLWGIGYGEFAGHAGQVAHNSFVHAFAELGFIGGTLFLGIFALCGCQLWSLRRERRRLRDPRLAELQPVLMAVTAAYCTSMMSLSQTYMLPTYFTAGMVAAHYRLACAELRLRPLRATSGLFLWSCLLSAVFIVALYVYITVVFRNG